MATLVPSLCHEVLPLVCVESMARRTPVVARNLGALSEVVRESGGGLLYDTDEELLGALRRLVASPALRATLADRGHATYESEWTPEVHIERYHRILKNTSLRKHGRVLWEI